VRLPSLLQDFLKFVRSHAFSLTRIYGAKSHDVSHSTVWHAQALGPAILVPKSRRRSAIGLVAGFMASFALVATEAKTAVSIVVGAMVGVIYAATSDLTRRVYADRCMTASALGVPASVFFGVILILCWPVPLLLA
jgi:hypothetical protein